MEPLLIKNFLPDDVLNFVNSYCVLKFSNERNFRDVDFQATTLIGEYSDIVMETLLDMSTPVIEGNVSKKLFPTYSYLRCYDLGSDLPVHTDRESCEYTVALCLGCDPIDKPYEIFLGEQDDASDYKYYNSKKEYTHLKVLHKFAMKRNDALIFKGLDFLHWREYCKHDHYITAFLHYVDQEGEYKDCKFDKREILGAEAVQSTKY